MKTIMKLLFAPVIAIMWLAIKAGIAITYISGVALGIISGIFAIIGIAYLFAGSAANGVTGLVIAYLLSPYGIPMFTIMILGVIQKIKVNLQDKIYG